MARRSCANCAKTCATAMRILVSFNFIAALCLIIFGSTVERPINSFPPIAMLLLAFLSIGSAICGLVGGHKWACCLDAFLVLHGINTLCQLILVIVLWADFQGVVQAIDPKHTGRYDREHVVQVITAAKWLMSLFMLCEVVAMILSILLRFWLDPPAQPYDNFDVGVQEQKADSAHKLRLDVEAGSYSTTKNSMYSKITAKMAKKYGAITHGFKWKKSWLNLGF